MGFAYSRALLRMDLKVIMMVSLLQPHVDLARALRMFNFFLASVMVFWICGPKQNMVSKVTPSRFGVSSCLTRCSWMYIAGWTWASAGSGVNSVTVDFSGDTISSCSVRKSARDLTYSLIHLASTVRSGRQAYTEISLAYCISLMFAGVVGSLER